MNEAEIQTAVHEFTAAYFSWKEMVDDAELQCAEDGFHAGVKWALRKQAECTQ